MASGFHFLSPKLLPRSKNLQTPLFPSSAAAAATTRLLIFNLKPTRKFKVTCINEEMNSDDLLAIELDIEISKLNSTMIQTEEAFKKSRKLLFTELCNFMGLKSEDLKKKWEKMKEEEKWDLAEVFVTEWSAHFHPLSAKSVKEMVDEHLVEQQASSSSIAAPNGFFPKLGKFIGLF